MVNLNLAIKTIDKVTIGPGEIFSFWNLVGKTTAKKGYIEGLQLSQGHIEERKHRFLLFLKLNMK